MALCGVVSILNFMQWRSRSQWREWIRELKGAVGKVDGPGNSIHDRMK